MENLMQEAVNSTKGQEIFGSQAIGQVIVSRLTVSIKTTEMLTLLARSVSNDIHNRLNQSGAYNFNLLTSENLEKYFKLLIVQRVNRVNDSRRLCMSKEFWKRVTMPATIFVLLKSIGQIKDITNGIIFTPVVNEQLLEITKEMSIEEMETFLEKMDGQLNSLKDVGLSKALVQGLPDSELGDIDFMTSEIISEELRSYRIGNLGNAVYRMFLESVEIQNKFKSLMNVRYISKQEFEPYIREFAKL